MFDIDNFLRECVYYPCSGRSGAPINFLGKHKRFQRFFYADYYVDRDRLEQSVTGTGLNGYQLSAVDELSPETVFGMSWKSLEQQHARTLSKVIFTWRDPYVLLHRFERADGFGDEHGPMVLELMYARFEGVATYLSAFCQRRIAPKCLVHICSGMGFGGNFSGYPKALSQALRANPAGLPAFMLHDRAASQSKCGDYLDLTSQYEMVRKFDYENSFLTFGRLIPISRALFGPMYRGAEPADWDR